MFKPCDIDIYYTLFQKQKHNISKTKTDNFEISSGHLIENKVAKIDKVNGFQEELHVKNTSSSRTQIVSYYCVIKDSKNIHH